MRRRAGRRAARSVHATHVRARATAGDPRDEPVEQLVEAGTQNDEQYEEPVEQARTQAKDQDEGYSDSQQVVVTQDESPVDVQTDELRTG